MSWYISERSKRSVPDRRNSVYWPDGEAPSGQASIHRNGWESSLSDRPCLFQYVRPPVGITIKVPRRPAYDLLAFPPPSESER